MASPEQNEEIAQLKHQVLTRILTYAYIMVNATNNEWPAKAADFFEYFIPNITFVEQSAIAGAILDHVQKSILRLNDLPETSDVSELADRIRLRNALGAYVH